VVDSQHSKSKPKRINFSGQVSRKEERKLRARRQAGRSLWYGLGLMGTVAWSIVIPTLLGIILGRWLDRFFQRGPSFTLLLLFAGLAVGCLTAWRWVVKEGGDDTEKRP
jgi:ATP synthase protein I